MKIRHFAILATGLLLMLWACSKNELKELNEVNIVNQDEPLFSSGPTVEVWEGMLFFAGQDHYDAVYEELDILNREASNDYEPTEEDYVIPNLFLDEYESSNEFSSLRKSVEGSIIEKLAAGLHPLEEDPDDHFIRDEIQRTLLNPDMEVRIGESIFKEIDPVYFIEIIDANLETLEAAREDWKSVMHQENVMVYVSGSATYTPKVTHQHCGFSVTTTPTNPACDNIGFRSFDVDFVNGYVPWVNWGGREVEYTWDWGDGSASETSTSIHQAHFKNHTFPVLNTPQTYTVTITGVWDNDPTCTVIKNETVTIQPTCDFNDTPSETHAQFAGSQERVFRGELWVEKTQGNGSNKFGGETKFYRFIRNKWRERNADRIVVQVWAEHIHQNCTNTLSDNVAEWPYNSKKASRTYNIGNSGSDYWGHMPGGVHSNHRVEWDNITYQFDLEYPYCN